MKKKFRYNTKKLIKARMIAGLNRCDLAALADLDTSTIGLIERGKFGSPPTIRRLAEVLHLKMEDLIIEGEKP